MPPSHQPEEAVHVCHGSDSEESVDEDAEYETTPPNLGVHHVAITHGNASQPVIRKGTLHPHDRHPIEPH